MRGVALWQRPAVLHDGWFADKGEWPGLKSCCMVKTETYFKKTGKTVVETRFFISSLPEDPAKALRAIRAHWGIEAMHWVLDMEFDEDQCRARSANSAENLAMLRHLAINILTLDKTLFGGINAKRKTLTWNDEKLIGVVTAA